MVMPQEALADTRAAEPSGTIPANTNTRQVVDVLVVHGLIDQFANSPLKDVKSGLAGLKAQIAAAAEEAVKRAPAGETEITAAPAIIVRRSIGEAISRGDLRPGQILPGQDIILAKVWKPTNRHGESLGKAIASFGAPENLSGEPRTFNRNQGEIGNLVKWHGHDGWKFDSRRYGTSSYEEARFKGYQDGSAIGNWGVPELPIVNGKDRDGKTVGNPSENMLVLSRDGKSDFKNFVTSGSGGAEWSQSCTESRYYPDYVHAVRFPDGVVDWDRKDYGRSAVRPSVALELKHLII